jgi:regulator of protease activity HflC (stomatin/prohibitin superfamily)
VQNELAGLMSDFGYGILKALVTNIDPDEKVKSAMNEINEQQRLRMAAQEKGEAEKILRVKNAEAEAESMKLQGMGVANQRKAIIEGLKESIQEFHQGVQGVSATDVMGLVMMTQYYDTLKEIGAKDKSSTILLPHSPGGLKDIVAQLRDGVILGNLTTDK